MKIEIVSPSSLLIDGVQAGAVIDTIANRPELAPDIQRELARWHASETASIAEAKTKAEADGKAAADAFITADAQADKAREEEIAQLEAEKAAAVLAAGQLAAEKADAEKAVAAKDAELAALKEKLGALTNALPSALTADDEPLAP